MEQGSVTIDLEPTELEYLTRPINGQGGYQSMLRRLQARVHDRQLVVSMEEAEHICQYAGRYGRGGFQGRLKSLAEKIQYELRNRAGDH